MVDVRDIWTWMEFEFHQHHPTVLSTRRKQNEINTSATYLSSSICTAWYHPIPRLGAPQPTRMTSAWPSLANMMGDPPKAREKVRAPFRALLMAKAEACRAAIDANMIVESWIFIMGVSAAGAKKTRRRTRHGEEATGRYVSSRDVSARPKWMGRKDILWGIVPSCRHLPFCRSYRMAFSWIRSTQNRNPILPVHNLRISTWNLRWWEPDGEPYRYFKRPYSY